jgi:hypothetical protein
MHSFIELFIILNLFTLFPLLLGSKVYKVIYKNFAFILLAFHTVIGKQKGLNKYLVSAEPINSNGIGTY